MAIIPPLNGAFQIKVHLLRLRTFCIPLAVVLPFLFVACYGGGGGNQGSTSNFSAAVQGSAFKGPFTTDADVTCSMIRRGDSMLVPPLKTKVQRADVGGFACTGMTWYGLTLIEIEGPFLDETTGEVIGDDPGEAPGFLQVVVNTRQNSSISPIANAKLATTLSAARILDRLSNLDIPGEEIGVDTVIHLTDQAVAREVFGFDLPEGIYLSDLEPWNTSDAALGSLNGRLLFMSAVLQDAINDSPMTDFKAINQSLQTDIKQGLPIGTTGDLQTFISQSLNAANADPSDVILYLPDGEAPATLGDVNLSINDSIDSEELYAVRGHACSGNIFTIENSSELFSASYDTTGHMTFLNDQPMTTLQDLKLSCQLKAYNNAAGDGPKALEVSNATLRMLIENQAVGDNQARMTAYLPGVHLTTNSLGRVTVRMDAEYNLHLIIKRSNSAQLTLKIPLSGQDEVKIITTNDENVLTISLYAILQEVDKRFSENFADSSLFDTAGNYQFRFAIEGIDLGFENSEQTGLTQHIPVQGLDEQFIGQMMIQ